MIMPRGTLTATSIVDVTMSTFVTLTHPPGMHLMRARNASLTASLTAWLWALSSRPFEVRTLRLFSDL